MMTIDYTKSYTGYYWYSNANKPIIITNEKIDASIFSEFPFIIEGNLYSEDNEERVSISIKNIDGKYLINQFNLGQTNEDNSTLTHYLLTNRFSPYKKIKLLQFWEEKEDELAENMKTLVPGWVAFCGFE